MEQTMLVGQYSPDFELPGTDGEVHHLARYLETYQAIAVVFMSNQCPYVNRYLERLKEIQQDFQGEGFTMIGINTNDVEKAPADSFEKMKAFTQDQALNFPYLRDPTKDVGKGFKVTTTPEVFLINQEGTIVYQGQIDDSPQSPHDVQKDYLRDHIAIVLSGGTIHEPYTKAVGSPIQWRES